MHGFPAGTVSKLEQRLQSGGAAVIVTDQVDAWHRTALVMTFPSAVSLVPLLEGCARDVIAALEASRAAGSMSISVIIEVIDGQACDRTNEIVRQMGLWIQTMPKGITVDYLIQTRSRSIEEMTAMYNNSDAPSTKNN